MEPVPFHVPSLDDADIPGVLEVLREKWVTTGPRARAFEAAFAEFITQDSGEELHALAVNSCTAALHLGLEAAGIGPGDRVVVPVWTFTASAEVVRYLGADPVFCDVDPTTFNLSVESIEAALSQLSAAERETVRAVIPVHFAGLACDMGEIEKFAADASRRWSVIDDAAHALPTVRERKMIGRFGTATAFSFYATKTLCTGEGGMIVTADAELAERMKVMRLHGMSRDAFDRYRSEKPAWEYEIIAPGFKYNMGDIAAALGLSQLKRVDDFQAQRELIAAAYTETFSGIEGLVPPPSALEGDVHAWHLYALRVEGGRAVRDCLIEELSAAEIGTSVHFIPLHRQPYWHERYQLRDEDFPVATDLFSKEVSLPIFPSMSDGQIERVIDEVPRALLRARARVGSKV